MIIVMGDYVEDVYIYGNIERLSPEYPIPIFGQTRSETRPGGASNVVENLKAFGEEVIHYGTKNSIKTRYVCDNHILFRSDLENYIPNEQVEFDLKNSKYVILSDYNKGFLHYSQRIINYCVSKGCQVIVDPKKSLDNYKNSSIIKLNKKEYNQYSKGQSPELIREQLNIGSLIITMGSEGAYLSSKDYEGHIQTDNHQVADVTGAGDVFIASLTYFIKSGNNLYDACKKANKLASISVTQFGTYILSKEDIKKSKVVFTNGCFDIIHKGHVDYLKKSKELGYKLIVGLNSDRSVSKLKGDKRPINHEKDRKTVLESLGCVDEVIIFDEDTPIELIKKIKPDIITKGGDYEKKEHVVGHELAEVIIIPYMDGYSTSEIIKRF